MTMKIFVNLPVNDLDASKAFFRALGFDFNPQFSDDTAACLVFSEHIYAMLLTHAKFKQFTKKEIADAHRAAEVLTALALDSRAQVDDLYGRAIKAGAIEANAPVDMGFMVVKSFADLDGHVWELFFMDPAHVHKS